MDFYGDMGLEGGHLKHQSGGTGGLISLSVPNRSFNGLDKMLDHNPNSRDGSFAVNVDEEDLSTSHDIYISKGESNLLNGAMDYNRPVGNTGVILGSQTWVHQLEVINIKILSDASQFGNMWLGSRNGGACSNGPYNRGMLFCGESQTWHALIYVFSITTGTNIEYFAWSTSNQTIRTYYGRSLSNRTGNYAVHGGVYATSYQYRRMYRLNFLTAMSYEHFGFLSQTYRYGNSPCSNAENNRGIFAGGWQVNNIDYITVTTPSSSYDFGDLSTINSFGTGASNGILDRGIFMGNIYGNQNTIEYITISTTGNAQDFGDLNYLTNYNSSVNNGVQNRAVSIGGVSTALNMEYITMSSLGNASIFGNLQFQRWYHSSTANG